jgi:hypothetical protein
MYIETDIAKNHAWYPAKLKPILAVCRLSRVRVNTPKRKTIPNNHTIYQIGTKYNKWPENRPKCHKIYQHLPLQVLPKFTQIRIFLFENMPSDNPGKQTFKYFYRIGFRFQCFHKTLGTRRRQWPPSKQEILCTINRRPIYARYTLD